MKKQMAYADGRKVAFVVLAGEEEMITGILTVKNMISGGQQKVNMDDLASFLQKQI
jgi:histidyl-tRNA synthetase